MGNRLLKILFFVAVLAIVFTFRIVAAGEWSEWWGLEQPKYNSWGGYVKRIYDKENKLVCWIFTKNNGAAIDCEPSIELGHPNILSH